MRAVLSIYRQILPPWICLTVYAWALELRAVIGTDSQPVSVWLADCFAILLTLIFWLLLFCLSLALLGGLTGKDRFVKFNRYAVNVGVLAVTAFYFVRWLLNWQLVFAGYDIGLVFLVAAALVLIIWTLNRRRGKITTDGAVIPSFEDCFSFAALPLLLGAIGLVGFKIGGEIFLPHPHSTVIASGKPFDDAVKSRKNVILIVSDAMRAQSMSLYGNGRTTTPRLDHWARSATVFLDAHTNSTSTKPSMTTILTGRLPTSHGRLTKAQPVVVSDENLLQVLREHGYYVGAVTSNEDASLNLLGLGAFLSEQEFPAFEFLTLSWLRRHGIYPTPTGGRMYQNLAPIIGFLGYPQKTSYYGSADDTLKIAESFLARAKKPVFLIIHLHEPHDPYDAPAGFRGIYASLTASNVSHSISSSTYGHYAAELQPAVDYYRDQYEESVRYLDEMIGDFLRQIDMLLGSEEYALIFTGDHGESFERGYMNHGEYLFESSTHVPLVIRFPMQSQGSRLLGLVQSVDIAPTILSIAGIDIPPWMDGRALHPDKAPESKLTFAINYKDPVEQKLYPLPTQLALWSKPYKIIVSCESGRAMLFNLTDDPMEEVDLSHSDLTTVKVLQNLLKAELARQSRGPKISCPVRN